MKIDGIVLSVKFVSLKHKVPSDLSVVLETYSENHSTLSTISEVGANIGISKDKHT